jgi:hypothetical protein
MAELGHFSHELSEQLVEFYKYFVSLGTGKSEN